MRLALIAHPWTPSITSVQASAAPPRDRTSRTQKALEHTQAEWSRAYELGSDKGPQLNESAPHGIGSLQACDAEKGTVCQPSAPPLRASRKASRSKFSTVETAPQLLYAAQVALSVLNPKGVKK